MSGELIRVSELRKELLAIQTPHQALDLAEKSKRICEAFKLIGKTVAECNEIAEIYLLAYWKFGDLVYDVPHHRPEKGGVVAPLPGSHDFFEELDRRNGRYPLIYPDIVYFPLAHMKDVARLTAEQCAELKALRKTKYRYEPRSG